MVIAKNKAKLVHVDAPTLVIMAAGLGSRFGGVKQLAKVGPNGEAFLDLSIKDAKAAGFGDVVLIVRSDIEADVREHIGAQHGDAEFRYVRQDDFGPARAKPWGTLHAVLSAAEAINGKFAAINADDYYGPRSFSMAVDCMSSVDEKSAALVAFELGRTVPPEGAVTRGVTKVGDGLLTEIVETEGCERRADGSLWAGGEQVPEDTPVSMNLWCFDPSVMDHFTRAWEAFLPEAQDDPTSECLLPMVVGDLMGAGTLEVKVVSSPENWIGITNPGDEELARDALASRA